MGPTWRRESDTMCMKSTKLYPGPIDTCRDYKWEAWKAAFPLPYGTMGTISAEGCALSW